MLEAALVCRKRNARALGTTEYALWNLGMELKRTILDEEENGAPLSDRDYRLCRGILPSLRCLVRREFGPTPQSAITRDQAREGAASVDINMEDSLVEADYNCQVCMYELANAYVRSLQGPSQRLCVLCHDEGLGTLEHRKCYRLTGPNGAFRMLQTIERKVGEDQIPYSYETEVRLRIAENRFAAAHSEKAKLLANVGNNDATVDEATVVHQPGAALDERSVAREPGSSSRRRQLISSLMNGADQPEDQETGPLLLEGACSSSTKLNSAQVTKKTATLDPADPSQPPAQNDESMEWTAVGTNEDTTNSPSVAKFTADRNDSKIRSESSSANAVDSIIQGMGSPIDAAKSHVAKASGASSETKVDHPIDVRACTEAKGVGVESSIEVAGPATSSHGANDAFGSTFNRELVTDGELVVAALSRYSANFKPASDAESNIPVRSPESVRGKATSSVPPKSGRRGRNEKSVKKVVGTGGGNATGVIPQRSSESAKRDCSVLENLEAAPELIARNLLGSNPLTKLKEKTRRTNRSSIVTHDSLALLGGDQSASADRRISGEDHSMLDESDASSASPASRKRRTSGPGPSTCLLEARTETRRSRKGRNRS
jgi:hypothetical protein